MRDKQIDILKAIGILLVVAGHAGSPLYHWIYSFHMPLFFFVSGFLRYSSRTKPWRVFLKDKAMTSLVPYVLFWFFSVVLYGNLYSLLRHQQFSPFGWDQIKGLLLGGGWLSDYSNNFPLWYLQHFFLAAVVFEILVRYLPLIGKGAALVILALLTVPIQSLLPGRPVFHINVLPAALVFMLMGYFFHSLLCTKLQKIKDSLPMGLLLLLVGGLISSVNDGNISNIGSYLYFPGALCTISGFYILSGKVKNCRILSHIGASTLFILGSHILCLTYTKWFVGLLFRKIGIELPLLENLLVTALTVGLCCVLAALLRYCKEKLISIGAAK